MLPIDASYILVYLYIYLVYCLTFCRHLRFLTFFVLREQIQISLTASKPFSSPRAGEFEIDFWLTCWTDSKSVWQACVVRSISTSPHLFVASILRIHLLIERNEVALSRTVAFFVFRVAPQSNSP